MRRILLWVAAAALALLPAAPAFGAAAPAYVTSDPQNGATVSSAPSRVSATFSEPLDAGSTLQVFDECGRAVDAGDAQVLGSRIDVGIAETPSGHYTAVYVAKGFGGATGETKGSFSFHVTSGVSCDGGHGEHGGHGGPGEGGGGEHNGSHGNEHGNGNGRHEGHRGDDDGHDGEAHGSMSGDDHGTHDSGSGRTHGDPGHGDSKGHDKNGHRNGHGGAHDKGTGNDRDSGDGLTELASGRGGLGLAPTGTSVIIALGLSIAMGALGGWVLRVSAGS